MIVTSQANIQWTRAYGVYQQLDAGLTQANLLFIANKPIDSVALLTLENELISNLTQMADKWQVLWYVAFGFLILELGVRDVFPVHLASCIIHRSRMDDDSTDLSGQYDCLLANHRSHHGSITSGTIRRVEYSSQYCRVSHAPSFDYRRYSPYRALLFLRHVLRGENEGHHLVSFDRRETGFGRNVRSVYTLFPKRSCD